jgi:hypothetical protein
MFGMNDAALVRRVRSKLKQPAIRAKVKRLLTSVTRADLQNPTKVRLMLQQMCTILEEPLDSTERERVVRRIIAQRIDPSNTWQLLRLWSLLQG